MNLYLLRHGIAVERGMAGFENDFARPLTPKGKNQLRKTCAALRKMKLDFDLILSSPLVRARQTAEFVARELKLNKRLQFSAALAPGADAKALVAKLNRAKPALKNLLLIGHEPDFSLLVSLLVTGDRRMELDFKKGGLCKLKLEKLQAGKCAALAWLLTPKQMKLMA